MCLENANICYRVRQCAETDVRGSMLQTRNMKCNSILNKPVFIEGLSYAVKLWLKHCATSRKVVALIPNGITAIFHWL